MIFNPQQELFLLEKAKKGDTQSLTALINGYTPFIKYRVVAYSSIPDKEDLVQEGLIGFLKAVRTYDEARQIPFRYYASICIASKMNSYLRGRRSLKQKALCDYMPIDLLDTFSSHDRLDTNCTDPSNIVVKQEELQFMNRQIRSLLSDFEQDALKLYLSGHTYEEMSEILHSTSKAVDNALQRVRRKLRTVL